ncbi:MAG: CS1-pili formation C-terminal domain-containing protein [Pseudomonadales bacterium]
MNSASMAKVLLTVCLLSASASTHASSKNSTGVFSIANASVPQGFELLLSEHHTELDVYFGGVYRGSVFASYTPGKVRFSEPENVLTLLGDLKPDHRESVYQRLGQEFLANSDKICRSARQTDCGTIEPDAIGIIFDDTRFRVDFFVNPAYLSVIALDRSRYIPDSSADKPSLTQMFGAVVSKTSNTEEDYNLVGNTSFSIGENSVSSFWDYSKVQGARVDTLMFQREHKGKQLLAGVFRTLGNGVSFSSDQKILGFRVASSLNTRADRELLQSNDILVFLPLPAQIDVLRDGRLLATGFYPAGNRLINTESLPSGAYTIALRITDEAGRVRQEQRFFVKELSLPPKDETQYYLEFGEGMNQAFDQPIPEASGNTMLRAGLSHRIAENAGLDMALAHAGSTSLLEFGAIGIGRLHRTQAGVMVSTDGDYGISFGSRVQVGAFSLSLDSRHLNRDEERLEPVLNSVSDLEFDDNFNLLPGSFSQHSISMNYALREGGINARLARIDSNAGESQIIRSFAFTRNLLQSAKDNLVLNLTLSDNEEDLVARIGLSYNFRSNSWSHSVSPELEYRKEMDDSDTTSGAKWRSSWRDDDWLTGDLRIAARGERAHTGDSVGATAEYSSQHGRAALEFARFFDNSEFSQAGTRVALNASTGFVSNLEKLAWGGQSLNQSAVLIDVQGDVKNAEFDVYVNDFKQGYVKMGTAGALQLAPFQQYNVRIKPSGAEFLGYEDRVQQATLYPGNVVALEWQANQIIIGFGQLLNARGEAIANAVLDGAEGQVTTDSNGIFQLEAKSNQRVLQASNADVNCTVVLPEQTLVNNGVHNFGQLSCF